MRKLSAVLAVACSLCAQQQTGAPAGVPVPSASNITPPAARQSSDREAHYRVHVLDGRNGAAILNAHVRLWYDEPAGAGLVFSTDAKGYANMPAPAGLPVRVLVSLLDYTDCRKPLRGDPPRGYSLDTIAKSGLAAENGCGQVAARPQPGELILFARPQRWFEELNHNSGN